MSNFHTMFSPGSGPSLAGVIDSLALGLQSFHTCNKHKTWVNHRVIISYLCVFVDLGFKLCLFIGTFTAQVLSELLLLLYSFDLLFNCHKKWNKYFLLNWVCKGKNRIAFCISRKSPPSLCTSCIDE